MAGRLYQPKNSRQNARACSIESKRSGEAGPVLERLEVRLGEGVVGRGVRPAVRLGDAEVGEQERDGLGGHRAAAVGVERELPAADLLLWQRLGDQLFGERARSRWCCTVQPTT